jgi:hypothetical protein
MELTEELKRGFIDTAMILKGYARRRFMAPTPNRPPISLQSLVYPPDCRRNALPVDRAKRLY